VRRHIKLDKSGYYLCGLKVDETNEPPDDAMSCMQCGSIGVRLLIPVRDAEKVRKKLSQFRNKHEV